MSETEGAPDFIPLEDDLQDPTGLSSLFARYGQPAKAEVSSGVPGKLPGPVPMGTPAYSPTPEKPTQDFSWGGDIVDAAALGHWNSNKQSALNELASLMQETARDDAGEIPDTFENISRNMGGVSGQFGNITKIDRLTRNARRATRLLAIKQELALAEEGIKANTRALPEGTDPNMINKIFQGAEPMAYAMAPQLAATAATLFVPEVAIPARIAGTLGSGATMGMHAYDATAAQALLQYGADKGVDITTPEGMSIAMKDPDFVAYRDRIALKTGAISAAAGTALGVAPGGAQALTKAATGKALAQTALNPTMQGLAASTAGQAAGLGTAVTIGTGQQVATNYATGRPLGEGVAEAAAMFGVQDLLLRTVHAAGGKGYDYYRAKMAGTTVGAPGAGAGPQPGPRQTGGTSSGPSSLNEWQLQALIRFGGMPEGLLPHEQMQWIKADTKRVGKAFAAAAAADQAAAQAKPAQPAPVAEPAPAAEAAPVVPVAEATAATGAPSSVADVIVPPSEPAVRPGNVPPRPTYGDQFQGRGDQGIEEYKAAVKAWDDMYGQTHRGNGFPKSQAPAAPTTAPATKGTPITLADVAPVVAPEATAGTPDFIPIDEGTALSARDEAPAGGQNDLGVPDEVIIRGAYKMPKFAGDYEAWANDMITDFGPEIEGKLPEIFDRALPIREKMDAYSGRMSQNIDKAGNLKDRNNTREQTGLPVNPLVKLTDEAGKPYYVGSLGQNRGVDDGKPTNAFIEEVESFVEPKDMKRFFQWYELVAPQFIKQFGSLDNPEAGIRMMTAWLAAQQNEGPSGALRNVFRKEDQLAGFKGFGEKGDTLKAGLADEKVEAILKDEVPNGGFGAKLTDFSFGSGTGRVTREYMGHDESAGSPFVADVWSGRDYGFIDSQTLNRLIEKAKDGKLSLAGINGKDAGGKPVKITPSLVTVRRIDKSGKGKPKDNVVASKITPEEAKQYVAQIEAENNPKVSAKVVVQKVLVRSGRKSVELSADLTGSPADGQYERASDWGNRITKDLNAMGYQGRKWVPSEVQALGWMAKMKQYGEAEATGSDAFSENTSRIAQTTDFSQGGLIASSHPEVASMPPEVRAQIAKDIVTTTANELARVIGGSLRVTGVTEGQAVTADGMAPSVVISALGSPEAKNMFAAALGLVGEHASVTTVEFGPGGKNSRTVHIAKSDGSDFTPEEKQSLGALIGPGLSIHKFNGVETALVTRETGKSLTEKGAENTLAKVQAWAEDNGVDLNADHIATAISHEETNWQSDKEGLPYQEAIVARGGQSRLRSILDYRERYKAVVSEAVDRARGGSEEVAQSARDVAPEPDSARDEVDRKAAELDRRIEARRQAQERNTNPETARRGNEQIAQRLVNELRNGGKLTHQEISAALRIVEKLMEHGYLDNLKVSVSVANPGEAVRGGYKAASELVQIFVRNTNQPGVFRYTFTHEVSHHLERMIPAKDLEAARQQFKRERAKWLQGKLGYRELLGEGNWLDKSWSHQEIVDFLATHDVDMSEFSNYFMRDMGTGRWRIKRTDETYRLTNFSEYFADKVADIATARDDARTNPQDPIGVWARMKAFFAQLKKSLMDVFGKDKVEKIWENFQRGKYTADFKRDNLHGYDRARSTEPVVDDPRTADYRARRMGPADADRQTRVDNIDKLEPNKPIPRTRSARDDGENTPIPGGYRDAFFKAKKGAGAPEPKQIKWWTDVGHDVEADKSKQFLWAVDRQGQLQVTSVQELEGKGIGVNTDGDEDGMSSGWTRMPTHLDWAEHPDGIPGLLSGPAHGRIDATGDVVRISLLQKNQSSPAIKAETREYLKGKLAEYMGESQDNMAGYDFTDAGPFTGPEVFSARDEEGADVPKPSRPGSYKAFDEMVTSREIEKPEGMPYPYHLKRFTVLSPTSKTARKNLEGYYLVQQGSDNGPQGRDDRREFRAVSKEEDPLSGKHPTYRILFQFAQGGSRGSKGSVFVTTADNVYDPPDHVKIGLISEIFERARQAGIKDITIDKRYVGEMSPEDIGLWGHVAKNEPGISFDGDLNTYDIDKNTAYSARDEEPAQAPMSVDQRKARIEEIKREILPLAQKGSLSREEGARYSKLGMELETHRFEMRAGRGLKLELVKPMQERGSAIPSEIVKIASDELASNRAAFEALTEASLGVGMNKDTAVDVIMNGKNPDVSPADLYSAFDRTREALRKQFGDTIVLYRAHGKQKQKATQNWHSTEAGAREYGNDIERRVVAVDDIVAVNVGLRGAYEEFVVGKNPASADSTDGAEFTTPGGELTNHGDKDLANGGFLTKQAMRIPAGERSRYSFAFAPDERSGGHTAQIKYDGKVVANLDMSSEVYEEGKGLIKLDMVDVEPAFQGRGLSTIMQAEVAELGKRADTPVDTLVATVLDPKVRPLKSMQRILGKDNVDILESTTETTDETDQFGYEGNEDDISDMSLDPDFFKNGQRLRNRVEVQGSVPQYTPEQRQMIKDINAARSSGNMAKARQLKAQFDQSVQDNDTQILSARDEEGDYRGSHRSPDGTNGEGSLDAMDRTYPEDIYGPKGAQYYGARRPDDVKIHKLIQSVRGNPDAMVTVYRAVPKGVGAEITPGNWVTPSREYAAEHGERFPNGYDILERQVRAGDLFTEGNSLQEFGWNPTGETIESARDGEQSGKQFLDTQPALPEVRGSNIPKGGLIAAVAAMTPTAAEAATRAGSAVAAASTMDIVTAAAAIGLAGNDRLLSGLNPIAANMHLLARDTKSPTILSVAEMFNRLGGNVAEGAQETYFEERDGNRRVFRNKLVEAFKPLAHLSEADLKALDQDIAMALAGEKTLTGAEGQVVANLQAFSDELFDYLREAGVKVNYAKDYGMPHSFNSEKVLTDDQAFLADATRAYRLNNPMRIKRLTDYIAQIDQAAANRGRYTAEETERKDALNKEINELQNAKPAEQAQALLEAIDTSNAGGDATQGLLLEAQGTGQNKADFTRERIFEPAARRILRDYFNNDPRHAWNSYIARATTLAEFARRFGGDGSKWTGMVRQMRAEKVSNKDITRIKNMVLDSLGVLNVAPTEGHALAVSILGLSNMAKLKSTALTNFLEAQAQAIPGDLRQTVTSPVVMLGQFMAIVAELPPRQQAQLKNLIGLELSSETGSMELARAVGLIDAAGVHEMMENSAWNIESAADFAGATKVDKAARVLSSATGALARTYGIEATENAKRAMAARYASGRLDAHVSEFLRDGLFARAWDKMNQNNPNAGTNPFTLRNEARMRLRRAGVSDAQMQAFAQWWETARASDFNAAIKGNDPMAKLARKVIRMESARASVNTNRAMKPGGKENPLVSQDTFAGKAAMTFLNYPATFLEQIGKPMIRDVKTAARGYESEGGQSTHYSGYERTRMAARAFAIPAMAVSAAVFLALRAWAQGHEDDVKAKPLWKHLLEGFTYTGLAGGKSEFASRVSRGQLPPILDEGNRLVRDMNRNDDKKNSKERAVTQGAIRGAGVPAALGLSSRLLPVPLAVVVNQALASQTFREMATDFIAGKAAPKKQGSPGGREGGSSQGREGERRPGR
jgi:hypothetical protein